MSEHGTKLLTKPELFTSARLKAELEAFGINTSARDKTTLVKVYQSNSTKIARMLKDASSRGRSSSRGSTPARKTSKTAGHVPAFVKNLSDRELHGALEKLEGSCGPVTTATRSILEKRYVRLLAEADEEREVEPEVEEEEEEDEDEVEEEVQTRVVTSRVVTSKPVRTVQTFRNRTKQVDRSTRTKPTSGIFSDEDEDAKPVAANSEIEEEEGDMMTVGFFCRLVLILILMVVIIAVFTEAGQEQLQSYIALFKGSKLASKALHSTDN